MNKYVAYVKQKSATISNLRTTRWISNHKKLLSIFIIGASLLFLIWYAVAHPNVLRSVTQTNPQTLLLLFILYIGVVGTHFTIMYATIKLCKKSLPINNGVLLTIYSVVANFFGPLQSGPGIRALYLKRKIGLRVRDYTFATLFYYFAFASINTSLLFIYTLPILTIIGCCASITLIAIGIKKFHFEVLSRFVFIIFCATIVQIFLMVTIYFTELHAVDPLAHYSYMQAIVYGASANLSLFVALTPGAIGIREAFILFSQSLHHIPLASVIAAGILDRAFYILFLVLLFALSSALHLKEMFTHKKNA